MFRQALYDELGGTVRARFHARAFALLTERGLDEDAVKSMLSRLAGGDQAAIAVLQRVGRAARSKGATASAMSILESAVALAGDSANAGLLCELAEAMATSGRPVTRLASASRIQSLADVPLMTTARMLQALARANFYLGAFEAAARLVDECVGLTEDVAPDLAIETLMSYTRAVYLLAGPAASALVLDRARAIALTADSPLGSSVRGQLGRWLPWTAPIRAAWKQRERRQSPPRPHAPPHLAQPCMCSDRPSPPSPRSPNTQIDSPSPSISTGSGCGRPSRLGIVDEEAVTLFADTRHAAAHAAAQRGRCHRRAVRQSSSTWCR